MGFDFSGVSCGLCDGEKGVSPALHPRFDVILIDPPWYEYHERAPTVIKDYWTAKEIAGLRIPELAADQCFLFMWCGSADALEAGRIIMRSWGFRRYFAPELPGGHTGPGTGADGPEGVRLKYGMGGHMWCMGASLMQKEARGAG